MIIAFVSLFITFGQARTAEVPVPIKREITRQPIMAQELEFYDITPRKKGRK
jgi:hypothetical protein